MSGYLYNNANISTNSRIDFLFDEYKQMEREVEQELINKAKQLSESVSSQIKSYQDLAKAGIHLLRKKIVLAYPESAKPSTTEEYVAGVVISEAERKFNSYNEFGGRLDRILKKLPESTQEQKAKPHRFIVDVSSH